METSNRNVASAAKQTALTALGGRLRAARTSASLIQQTVAERLGVSPQTVRNWETGRHEPTEQATEALASLYGIPSEHLRRQTPGVHSGDQSHRPNQHVKVEPHLLTDAREASGLTRAEAAEHSGVSTASIRRYEQGKARPTRTTMRRLALIYGKPSSSFDPNGVDNTPVLETPYMDEAMHTYLLAQPDLTPLSVGTIADFILFTHQQQMKRSR